VKRAGTDLGVKRIFYDVKKTGLVIGIAAALLLVVGLIISFPERKGRVPDRPSQPDKMTITKKTGANSLAKNP